MKVSVNTIRELTGLDLPPVSELVERINAQLGGVEEVIDLGARYKDARIVVIAKCEKHPNADKLSVCLIDDGGVIENIARDEDNLIQVVCGAPNARGGMLAVWLPPNATVPSTYDDEVPFVLEARELRGVVSSGMLAAADELAIGSDHDGIIEITEDDLPAGTAKPDELIGTRFAEVFGLDDYIIDIENKMFTHRPDLFGQMGVAREIYAILQPGLNQDSFSETRFNETDWYWQMPQFDSADVLPLAVANEAPEAVPRLMAVALSGVQVKPSPLWLQTTLLRWGSKSINNVVDMTNYIMLLTAQPTHAYDYDKLRGNALSARMARDGETVKLLNGKSYELASTDIVIADGEGAVGLAGIMGGGDSEVSDTTTNLVLEVATFDMYTVRRSAMRHGLFTDALTRFNKGQSPLQNNRVLARLMQQILDVAGGQQASAVFDEPNHSDELDQVSVHPALEVRPSFVNQRLGLDFSGYAIGNILRYVGFATYPSDENDSDAALNITAPFWRTDIELPEDIVEEVGRLHGFDNLPRELPQRTTTPAPVNPLLAAKSRLRRQLEKYGANEVLTYSFVHEKVIKNAQQTIDAAFRLSNALSPDLQYYRLSVLPSLLDKVHMNIKAGHDEFVLYELGKAHHKQRANDEGLPREYDRLAAVYASKQSTSGAPYYYMRRLVQQLAIDHNFTVTFTKLADVDLSDHAAFTELATPFDPQRAAVVVRRDTPVGVVGELDRRVKRAFKLPQSAAAMELKLSLFVEHVGGVGYTPLSKYPSITQDVSLKVSQEVSYEAVFSAVNDAVNQQSAEFAVRISPLSIYQADDDDAHKTVTLRIELSSNERTLTEPDASAVVRSVAAEASKRYGAEQI